MNDTDMKAMFRRSELEERSRRRLRLMQQIKNELALTDEPLSADDRKAHEEALKAIREVQVAYIRMCSLGYWRTLWLALKGKL